MATQFQLWRSDDRTRWFLVPAGVTPVPGTVLLRGCAGKTLCVAEDWARRYEVEEAAGRDWARHELGDTLEQLKAAVDARLADGRAQIDTVRHTPAADGASVTPDAVPAIWSLLKALPGVIGGGLSGEARRVARAHATMVESQRRLADAGINVDTGIVDLPDRLAKLRADFAARRSDDDPPAER